MRRCAGTTAVSVAPEVDTIVEALRATREVATVTDGLKKLSKALRGEHAAETLSALLQRSPHCEELHRLWDAPIMVSVQETSQHVLTAAASGDMLLLQTLQPCVKVYIWRFLSSYNRNRPKKGSSFCNTMHLRWWDSVVGSTSAIMSHAGSGCRLGRQADAGAGGFIGPLIRRRRRPDSRRGWQAGSAGSHVGGCAYAAELL